MTRLLSRNRYFLLLDAVMIVLAAPAAFLIRLDVSPLFLNLVPMMAAFAALGLLVKLPTYYSFGLYRHFWRYASINELKLIVGAVTMATGLLTLIVAGVLLLHGLPTSFPRSVLVIDWLLMLVLVGGSRFLARVHAETAVAGRTDSPPQRERRVLVAGAGDSGTMIVREMQHNPRLRLVPVGFVDDDANKVGKRIRYLPVLGSLEILPTLVVDHNIHEVIIAMPTAPGKIIRKIIKMCERANVPSRTMPGIYELLDNNISLSQLRNVQIDDLLRREPVQTDIGAVLQLVRGKRVLVTGGGGSIGRELCRQLLRCEPAELVILGHGENSIFEGFNELRKQAAPQMLPRIQPVIADIRFADRVQAVFNLHRPELVFHAAAHKHVPLMEANPAEAITNNVLGTRNLLGAALQTGVERFVMISTDKAVNPTNMMGVSKRVAELLVHQAAQQSGKPFVAVRFGNVLGSRGSVIPTFKQQIAAGGPVTVTHPDMTRYFMSIPEAVQLVLQAAVLGGGGEVFALNMGEPVKIVDLAHDLIRLSGMEVGRDIDVTYTGLRPGEKLFEELFVPGENYRQTQHEKIFIAANASSFVSSNLSEEVDLLLAAAQNDNLTALQKSVRRLVPEYAPQATPARIAPPDPARAEPDGHLRLDGLTTGVTGASSLG